MTDVVILLGSKSDREIARKTIKILDKFDIDYKVTVASAHRTPKRVTELIEEAHKNDVKVFIAVAGLAAHLPGVVAAHTIKPVIGVPVNAQLEGNDSLLSIVQMPPGVPVACVGIGRGDNAAILAAQIMAVDNKELELKLQDYRKELSEKVEMDAMSLFE
ncbi:5-(carboxyamino)imidazole ribonucleotide mutase [Methanosalsum natronophilum]|uniref:N5-carboxyaminoimidazole ribonucleotide mutase n=1 Tax=Methanosalsum natronophilum TaxID=768733 RepID=A0A424YT29_9EURY|nr:5-(carboxyamino)imidazole ribonucleotide mutase [Methanosalsum natronophilum]MCS3923643.1 5-(carboxyamino)imidazole ribonucleotide mutase [Methanosalsum natronophilum]RQD82084.1 MAG: 5-(carboxyamino)imidazole ribonucleotide mutase [Methanosalsum natronophilum]